MHKSRAVSVSHKRLVLTSRVGESEAISHSCFAIEPSGLINRERETPGISQAFSRE